MAAWRERAREFLLTFETIQRIEVAELSGSIGVVLHTPEAEVWLFLKDVRPEQFRAEVGA